MRRFRFVPVILSAALALTSVACTQGQSDTQTPHGNSSQSPSALSAAEQEGLIFTREEEKLARDVYSALADGRPIFDNISSSEQRHFDAIGDLLDKYGLEDPTVGLGAGQFSNPDLQKLYDDLVAQGSHGPDDALEVGCLIEELDIHDLDSALAATTHSDIQSVYENLQRGSRNHLRAFYGNLTSGGGDYTPVHLDQTRFDQIVSSEKEMGGGM
ncbi:MAG: DUF2202 domain-containing protein [Polyangiaceae bacterium]|nr:DUF2202 domain-containing protein [Myxococcales bacterium]MCB9587581.1 DUF2202 domain-containing protein [Polyangiaceae bacterium]MCB9605622.1 DUF2202 domain-containing protein [Polyangiaceae bacterium]